MADEQRIKQDISALLGQQNVKGGFLLAYIEGGKIQMTGTLSVKTLAPLLLKGLGEKFS